MTPVFFWRRLFVGVLLASIIGPFLGWWVMMIGLLIGCMLPVPLRWRVLAVIAAVLWTVCAFSRLPILPVASLVDGSPSSWKRISWSGRPRLFFREEKEWLWRRLRERFSKPEAELLAGLLYGDASTEARATWKTTGVIHLLAVSGANIAFYIEGANGVFRCLRLSRRQRFLWSSAFLCFFLLFAGKAPSLIRASLFCWVIEFARERGRVPHAGHLFLLILTLHLLFVPTAFVLSVGFILSYLAFLVLLVVNELVKSSIARIVLAQIGCFLVSVPVLMWLQGSVAWTGVLLGPLLAWLLPLGTSMGILSLAPGLGLLSWPAFFLLRAALFFVKNVADWNVEGLRAHSSFASVIVFEVAFVIGGVFFVHRLRPNMSKRSDVDIGRS